MNCPECNGPEPRRPGRYTTATVDGVAHAIPDMWLAGVFRSFSTDLERAANQWHDQCKMATMQAAERAAP